MQEEDKLARPPKGFDVGMPHIEYLKLKSYIVWKETRLTQSVQANIAKDLVADFKASYPLIAWLRQAK